MRSGAEIAAQIKSKAAETVKNEVIALSEEEFYIFAMTHCPNDFNLHDFDNCGSYKPKPKCTKCWKKATGRK